MGGWGERGGEDLAAYDAALKVAQAEGEDMCTLKEYQECQAGREEYMSHCFLKGRLMGRLRVL